VLGETGQGGVTALVAVVGVVDTDTSTARVEVRARILTQEEILKNLLLNPKNAILIPVKYVATLINLDVELATNVFH